MHEQQQQLDPEELTIRTGIQAGDVFMGSGGATGSSGSDDDPSRGGYYGSGH